MLLGRPFSGGENGFRLLELILEHRDDQVLAGAAERRRIFRESSGEIIG